MDGRIGQLAFETSRIDGSFVIAASGEVDIANAPSLAKALEAAIDERSLILSLEAVRYIDSSGLSVLIREHKRRSDSGAGFHVVLPDGPAARVFGITELSNVFPCHTNLADAIAAARPADEALASD